MRQLLHRVRLIVVRIAHANIPSERLGFVKPAAGVALGILAGYLLWNHPFSHSILKGDSGPSIPDFVEKVRNELVESDLTRQRNHLPALFTAKSVDLEMSLVVKRSISGGSKFSVQLADIDSKIDRATEQTQKLVLHLDINQPENVSIPPDPQVTK